MKNYLILIIMLIGALNLQAQIGYQISLLNTATGEPRANETVNVTVTLTNSEGGIIYTGNQSATTNDFGVLSLTIGDADTFKEVDVTKMPFYVEVTANGVSIGKSQVLSVPVAEYAKRTGAFSKELLVGTWVREYSYHEKVNDFYYVSNQPYESVSYTYTIYKEYQSTITFNMDGTVIGSGIMRTRTVGKKSFGGVSDSNDGIWNDDGPHTTKSKYFIEGNQVLLLHDDEYIIDLRENAVITHEFPSFTTKWSDHFFYFDSIGILKNRDGLIYTKQQ